MNYSKKRNKIASAILGLLIVLTVSIIIISWAL